VSLTVWTKTSMPVKHQHVSSELRDAEASVPSPEVASAVELPAAEKHTYGQILKSLVLIGGSSVLNICIGIVRTKAMAVLLGPAGFGLMGLYGSIADLAVSIAGMGVNSSGVRQIAEAAGSGDAKRMARTVTVLRRTAVLLGILGASLLIVFPQKVSELTFGADQHAGAVALLSLAVFFRLVAGGQGAVVQGMRRIADLAKMGVLGALFGTMISIPVVMLFPCQLQALTIDNGGMEDAAIRRPGQIAAAIASGRPRFPTDGYICHTALFDLVAINAISARHIGFARRSTVET
jgi:Na+-driven multidrug efflux pump